MEMSDGEVRQMSDAAELFVFLIEMRAAKSSAFLTDRYETDDVR